MTTNMLLSVCPVVSNGPCGHNLATWELRFMGSSCELPDPFGGEIIELDDCEGEGEAIMLEKQVGPNWVAFNWQQLTGTDLVGDGGEDIDISGVIHKGNTVWVSPVHLCADEYTHIISHGGVQYAIRQPQVKQLGVKDMKHESNFMLPGGNAFKEDSISCGTRIPGLKDMILLSGMDLPILDEDGAERGRRIRLALVDERTGERVQFTLVRRA